MSGDITQFLQEQRSAIIEDKKKLGLLGHHEKDQCDTATKQNNNTEQSLEENKENLQINSGCVVSTNTSNNTLPFNEVLELNSNRDSQVNANEEKKQAFVNAGNPFTEQSDDNSSVKGSNSLFGCAMLRYGEYSPNNPQVRGATQAPSVPFLGLGEYDQHRNYFLQKQRADYLKHLAKIQYEPGHQKRLYDELSPRREGSRNYYKNDHNISAYRVDQRLTSAQNALLNQNMDKPKSILSNRRTGSPRDRLLSDLYTTNNFTDGYTSSSYHPSLAEELDRERMKREAYQRELRVQIEEKRLQREMREERERAERETENVRIERQLSRMREERAAEERIQRGRRDEQMRRHSDDLLRRKQELHSRHSFRKHTDSESSLRNNPSDFVSKSLSHYSPPVSRRNPPYSFNIPSTSVFAEPQARYNPNRFDSYHRKDTLNRMDSLNSYELPNRCSTFNRFDSLSRIDSLSHRIESINIRDGLNEGQRRHSATQQDLSMMTRRGSPRLQRRSSSSRFEDGGLPTPQVTKRSPVARELRNAIPCKSDSGLSLRRSLEDSWLIPPVQKNSLDVPESQRDGQNRSILTQLGAIRMQLRQEQLRMDETLRKRGITQSKAVDFH